MASSNAPHPLFCFIAYDKICPKYRALLKVINSHSEPRHYSQAVKDPKWREAIAKEIFALEDNHTWEYAPLPPGKKTLGSK